MSIARSFLSNGDIKNLPKYHRWIAVDNGEKSNEFDSYACNVQLPQVFINFDHFTHPYNYSSIMSSNAKIGKYQLQVIHPGLQRAGSTSLAQALEILGISNGVWHPLNNSNDLVKKGLSYWIDNKFDQKIEDGTMNGKIFDKWLETINCDCIMDAPSGLYWQTIFEYYPNSKVIVTMRDLDEVYKSSLFWMNTIIQSWWFKHVLARINKEVNWVANTYVRKVIESVLNDSNANSIDDLVNDSKYFKKYCNMKIETIQKIVPKDQLLIFNAKDGWEPLCTFLKVDIPKNIPYPRKNTKSSSAETFIRSYLQLKYLWFLLVPCIIAIVYIFLW